MSTHINLKPAKAGGIKEPGRVSDPGTAGAAMRLRMRKWGIGFGITLLPAVVITYAMYVSAALPRQSSAQDMLRSIPLFPTARRVAYSTLEEPTWASWYGETVQVVYRVDETPQSVFDFYSEKLTRSGWQINELGRQRWEFSRYEGYISRISLKGDAPWIHIEQGSRLRRAYVLVYRAETNGQEYTEVTFELTPTPYYGLHHFVTMR
jgi:hypothetical protein